MRHLGAAALNGDLDRDRLRALPYDDALVELQHLAGIGPYSAELIMIRGVGIPDALPVHEQRFSDAVRNYYGVDEISVVAENWRPYQTGLGSCCARLQRSRRRCDTEVPPRRMDFTMAILFIHGAGGFTEDRAIADAMGSALGLAVDMPEFSDTNMSFEAWADPVRRLVGQLSSEDIVVAHSFGASILLRVLAEGIPFRPERAFLLAMPDWSPEGWDVEEYAFSDQSLILLCHFISAATMRSYRSSTLR